MIHALVLAAALAGDRGVAFPLRTRQMEAEQVTPGGVSLEPQTAQAINTTDSSSDPEVRRIESILQKMQRDPAMRQRLYDDVDSVVRAVRGSQPIPDNLRVGYGLPVTEHRAQPNQVAILQPPFVTALPFPGSSIPQADTATSRRATPSRPSWQTSKPQWSPLGRGSGETPHPLGARKRVPY